MLTPEELAVIAETMYPIIDQLNEFIIRDRVERIMARLRRDNNFSLSASDIHQIKVYQNAGGSQDKLMKAIQDFTNKSDKEVASIFEDAAIRSWNDEDAFYQLQGFEGVSLLRNESMMRILTDVYQRTNSEIHNFTRTLYQNDESSFVKLLDRVYIRFMSGAQSYTEEVKDTVN